MVSGMSTKKNGLLVEILTQLGIIIFETRKGGGMQTKMRLSLAQAVVGLGIVLLMGAPVAAQQVDFSHCQNDNAKGSKNDGAIDACVWGNGAINPNNSDYAESDAIPQRLLLTGFDSPGNQTLVFRYDFTKASVYAFDFLVDADHTMPSLLVNPCGNLPANPGLTFQECFDIYSSAVATPIISDGFDAVAAREHPPSRNLLVGCIDGSGTPVACSATVTSIVHKDAASGNVIPDCFQNCGNSVAELTLQVNVPSTDTVMGMWFGAHLAPAEDPNPGDPNQDGWGPGFGASSAPGASFDLRLVSLNGASLGSLVNQVLNGLVEDGHDADLSITKADSVDPVTAGNELTYTLTVNNNGPDTVTQVLATDTLPSGVTFVSAIPGRGSCSENSGVIGCELGLMEPGDTVNIAVTVVIPEALAGTTITNTAVVSGSTDDVPGNNTATENTTVVAPTVPVDLSITKSDNGTDPVVAGEQLTYTLTVTNNEAAGSGIDATNVVVTDTLPGGTSYVSAIPSQGSCTTNPDNTVVSCTLGDMLAGADATVTIAVAVDPFRRMPLLNTATVTGDETDDVPGNNSAEEPTAVAAQTDLSITKTDDPDPVVAGNQLDYTIVVTNLGSSGSNEAEMVDNLPPGVSFVSATASQGTGCTYNEVQHQVVCDLGDIPPDGTANMTVVVAVDPSTTGGDNPETPAVTETNVIVNYASTRCNELTCTEIDVDPTNNSTWEDTEISPPAPATVDLGVVKSDSPGTVVAGEQLTYTVDVTNHDTANTATNVVMTDPLPATVSFVSATPTQGTCGAIGNLVQCSLGDLAPSASAQVVVVVDVSPSAFEDLSNTVTVSSDSLEVDPDVYPNSDTEITALARVTDLGIVKTGSPDPVTAGEFLTYTLTVTSHGPSDSTGSTVTDTLPPGVTYDDDLSSPRCDEVSAGVVECNVSDLPAGTDRSFDIVVQVDPGTTGPLTNTVVVVGQEAEPDPDPNPNTDQETTAVDASADLVLTKTASTATVMTNAQFSYTIAVQNLGPSASSGGTITDNLPTDLTFVSADTGCTYDGNAHSVTCTVQQLDVDASQSFQITVQAPDAPMELLNVATVVGNEPDPDTSNDSDEEPNTVIESTAGIPTVSEWGMILMVILLAGAGLLRLRSS